MVKRLITLVALACYTFFLSTYTIGCKSKENYLQKDSNVPSKPLTKNTIKNYNDFCIEKDLWTGSVVLYGTLEDGILFQEAYGYTSTEKNTK